MLDEESNALFRRLTMLCTWTARSYDRIVKVARTIADLAGSEDIRPAHLAEALRYRAQNVGEE